MFQTSTILAEPRVSWPRRAGRLTVPATLIVMALITPCAAADAFTWGNLLISTNNVLYEYTPSGVFVQSFPIVYPGGYPPTEYARDIAVDGAGAAHVYNGTFAPYLSTFDPVMETWSHQTYPGWCTVNNGSYGGIGTFASYAFVTDMYGGGGYEAHGVVRFDLSSSTAVRFATNIEPIDLNIGLDGLLYALYPGGSPGGRMIDVYDPASLTFIRRIDLTDTFGWTEHRSVAVNAAGELFIADWDGDLQKLDADGNLLDSVNLGDLVHPNLYDVDVSSDGLVVVGNRFGGVVVTDEDFSSPTTFSVGGGGIFVHIIPEPGTALALTVAFCALVARTRRAAGG